MVKNSGIIVLDASIKMAFRLFEAKMNEKKKEEALESAKKLLRTAFDSSLDSFLIFKSKRNEKSEIVDFIFMEVNSRAEEMLQMGRSSLIGRDMCEVLPINRSAGFFEKYKAVVETGVPLEEEFYLPDTNVPAAWHYHQVVRSGDGILIIHRDITERKRADLALSDSEEKLKSILTNITDVVWSLSYPALKPLYISPSAEKFYGHPVQRFYEDPSFFEELVHPDDRHTTLKARSELFETGMASRECRITRPDGEVRHIIDRSRIARDSGGAPVRIDGIVTDITERREAEARLRETFNFLQSVLQTTRDGYWVVNDRGRILDVNSAYCEMTGYGREEVLKMSINDIDIIEDSEETAARLRRIVANGHEAFQTRQRRKDGSIFDAEVSASFLDLGAGHFVSFCRDVTEQKRSQEMIKNQLKEKEVLLKEVHHRIKNNIASIASLLRLQADSIENAGSRHILNDALGRVESMRIIYDRLLLSDDYREASVKNYLEDLVSAVGIFPENIKITLITEIEDLSFSVKHLFALGTIVNELVTNSMKYAFSDRKAGAITVTLAKNGGVVALSVHDDGRGLPENFDSGESAGFGLMLVNLFVQQLKGVLSVENRNGALFTITFSV